MYAAKTGSGLRYAAGALALLVAGIHIYWGFPRLLTYLQAGLVPDPRPIIFVVTGIAIILGIAQILDGRNPRPIYLAGIGLMVAYLGGYALWHTGLAHGAFWPWGPEAITHEEPAVVVVLEHLLADPLALASKVLEATLAGLLVVLYRSGETAADDQQPAGVHSP